jgi:hypothetical protein
VEIPKLPAAIELHLKPELNLTVNRNSIDIIHIYLKLKSIILR